jgi:hypothetical protein
VLSSLDQRRRLQALGLALCVTLSAAQADLIWPQTQWTNEARPGEKRLTAEFPFTNAGSAPVTILDVASSCGCTVADLPQRTYAPGESGVVRALFEVGERVGPQDQVIRVETDTGAVQELRLRFDIPAFVTLSASVLLWRGADDGAEQAVELTAARDYRIARLTAGARTGGAEPGRLEQIAEQTRYRLWLRRPPETGARASVTYTVTLVDGAEQNFVIHLLAR